MVRPGAPSSRTLVGWFVVLRLSVRRLSLVHLSRVFCFVFDVCVGRSTGAGPLCQGLSGQAVFSFILQVARSELLR